MTEDELQKLAAAHRIDQSYRTSMDLIVEMLADIRQRLARIEKIVVTAEGNRNEWGLTPAQEQRLRQVAAEIRKEFGFDK